VPPGDSKSRETFASAAPTPTVNPNVFGSRLVAEEPWPRPPRNSLGDGKTDGRGIAEFQILCRRPPPDALPAIQAQYPTEMTILGLPGNAA